MLIDLQMVGYSPPASELNFFICTSMTGDVRKPHMQAYLDCYHDTLSNTMEAAGQEAPFTKKQLLKTFKDKNLFGAVIGLVFTPVIVIECDDDDDSSKDNDKYIEDKLTKTREKAMQTIDSNTLLKPRFLSLVDELMEIGLIS